MIEAKQNGENAPNYKAQSSTLTSLLPRLMPDTLVVVSRLAHVTYPHVDNLPPLSHSFHHEDVRPLRLHPNSHQFLRRFTGDLSALSQT